MAAGGVEFGCVIAAAGTPEASDFDLYRGMLADCELYSQLGYDAAWVLEHHFSDYFPTPDPALLIAHLAGRYPRLSFGTCVIVTPWHHPLRLAGQIAMLTELTDRPLHLGLGRGTAKLEFDAFGLDMGEARQRFQETWEILRLGMAGEPFSYPGTLRPIPEPVRIRPAPRTGQLHFYGAIGSPGSAAIMARLGLPPLCNTIGDIQQQAGTLRAWEVAATEVGLSTSGVTFPIMIDCIVEDTDEEAIRKACRYKPRFMQAQIDHYAPRATDWVNTPGYEAWQRIFAGMEERTRPEGIVPWCEWQLIGSVETVVRKLNAYLEVGFNHIILHFATPGIPIGVRHEWATRFANDVRRASARDRRRRRRLARRHGDLAGRSWDAMWKGSPVTQRLRVNDVTFSVETAGSGPPIVFIHGWTMSGRFFRRQLDGLSGSLQVIVPDLRGHGASEKVLHGHTVPQYASDLHAILAELSVQRPVLVGWSMGAMVAYEYLSAYGRDAVAGIVIVDQPPSDYAWEGYEFGIFTMDALRQTNEQLQLEQATVVDEFTRLMLHRPDEETLQWMAAEILQVPPVIASTILLDQTLRDYRSFLPRIDVPALVLFGEDDKLTSPKAGAYIADRIPGSRLQTFAESSHCPFWEESEVFNDAVAAFAAELG